MKKFLIAVILVISGFVVNAQNTKVLDAVSADIHARYPNAKTFRMEGDAKKLTSVKFVMDEKRYSVRYDEKGQWQGATVICSLSLLPQPVKDGFNASEYKDWKITDVYCVENSFENTYFVEVKNKEKKILSFNSKGVLKQ